MDTKSTSRIIARWLAPLFVGVFCVAASSFAVAQEDKDAGKLDSVVKEMANKLAEFLKDEDSNSVAIGKFTGPSQLTTTAGPAIKNRLVEALKVNDIELKRRAGIGVTGEYYYDSDDGTVLLRMKAMKGARELIAWDKKIYDVADMASLLGLSGKTSVEATPAEQRDELIDALENLEVVTDDGGTLLQPTPESLYAIEVLRVEADGTLSPLPVSDDDGLAHVDLKIEDTYVIRVINNSPHYAAVKISIDGLNMFEFSEVPHYRASGHVLIPPSPKGSLIRGWHINNRVADSFLVADYAQSERGKREGFLVSDVDVATITAQFAVAVPPGAPFPADEPGIRSLGTIRGPSIDANFRSRPVRIGQIREFVSVRYARPLPLPPAN